MKRTQGITCVFGKRNHGKTTYIKNYIKGHKRVLVYDFMGEFVRGYKIIYSYMELIEYIKEHKKFKISLRVNQTEFEKINKIVFEIGHITYVIDEADQIMSPHKIPEFLSYIVRYGSHREILLLCTSRRPSCVSRELTACADMIVVFRITEFLDLKYLNEYIDFQYISGLQKYQYLEVKI